jgi:hypothetical protein
MGDENSYEKNKTLLRRSLNLPITIKEKAQVLHNLSVLIYFECKTHNKLINFIEDQKKNKNEEKNTFLYKRNQIVNNLDISTKEDSLAKLLSKKDQEFIEKEKKELEQMVLSSNPKKDAYLKKALKLYTADLLEKEKMFSEIKNFLDNTKNPESEISEDIIQNIQTNLENSKLPEKEKVDVLTYNIENYGDINEETEKLFKNNVDYEKDFDSIFPNLFICLKIREQGYLNEIRNYKITNLENNEDFITDLNYLNNEIYESEFGHLSKNYSSTMDLKNFLLLDKNFLEFYLNYINYEKKSILHSINLEKKIENERNKYLNKNSEILYPHMIQDFSDIMQKDQYFTLIKNYSNLRTVLFIAELFTENSKNYPEECEYWLKYSITMATFVNDESVLLRCLVLAAGYIIDNKDTDLNFAEVILKYLETRFEQDKDKFHLKHEIPTYTMALHLLGILTKADPKKKGEGLALLEKAKSMRDLANIEEKTYFLQFERTYYMEMDYDEETLNFIESEMKKDEQETD